MRCVAIFFLLLVATSARADPLGSSGEVDVQVACARKMRKTLEALQAWRRSHDGSYPGRLADLVAAGFLQEETAICPAVLLEQAGGDPNHQLATSRSERGDPLGMYEYELSNSVAGSRAYFSEGRREEKSYTRQELKAELLRRQFAEQVPILRCAGHLGPGGGEGTDLAFRNITFDGKIYSSGKLWETRWLNDVPYCCRDANVLFGLKGPPFHSSRPPELPSAVDLRPWTCAFGDHPWWWTYPTFGEGDQSPSTPALMPFFQERHGRIAELNGQRWWLDGLVQLQGRISSDWADAYRAPTLQTFVWNKERLPLKRRFAKASWLQGTVWAAARGQTVGWLRWDYADGSRERVPIIYGETTARFWADATQQSGEEGIPRPAWEVQESAKQVGQDRWLRIYEQSWTNPKPDQTVEWLSFESHRESPAAPFLIALNVY